MGSSEDTDILELPLLKLYEEKRGCPRVDVRVPVTVTALDGPPATASVRNVSLTGLQLRCNVELARRLCPDGAHIRAGQGAVVKLELELPDGGAAHAVTATGQLVYMAVRRRGVIAFGVEFVTLGPDSKANLEAFIEQALLPLEDAD